jgi:hypothetical protein
VRAAFGRPSIIQYKFMKKTLLPGLLLTMLLLSGCFNITDEIFLEKDGSGRYSTVIDMSKLKEMLDMVKTMMPDTAQGQNNELKDLDSLQNMWKDLENIPGISEVKRQKNDKYVISVSFRFTNISALNDAMSRRAKKEDQPPTKTGPFYSFIPGQFSCNDTTLAGMGDVFKGMNKQGESNDSLAMAMTMMKGMMGDMSYTSIYHLPGKVSTVSNKQAKVSEDGKTVTLKLEFTENEYPQTLKNEIKYQK